MKRISAVLGLTLAFAAMPALASDHGYVRAIMDDDPASQVYRVNVDKINGEEPSPRPNHPVPAGKSSITVSVVFNPSWGHGMRRTDASIYSKDFDLEVESGKTYVLGARVDTSASKAAQEDGSFWTPVIVRVE